MLNGLNILGPNIVGFFLKGVSLIDEAEAQSMCPAGLG